MEKDALLHCVLCIYFPRVIQKQNMTVSDSVDFLSTSITESWILTTGEMVISVNINNLQQLAYTSPALAAELTNKFSNTWYVMLPIPIT